MDPYWYKDAVIYELHVRSFFDSNGDGVGDFAGVREKLDYLQELGVDTLWLLPFYESPLRDDGYDIADYRRILPVHGTLEDFGAFLDEAHERGLRVLTELVANHTSDQHPWFQEARHPDSAKRDWYMWSDTPDRYRGVRIIFQDYEHSNWQWDPVAKAYYWHRFFSHQPDLNWSNPEVERAIHEALFYWMDLGVDGVRLDAVPYLYAREGTSCENLPETIEALRRLRRALDDRYGPGRILLAEANQWPEDTLPYFGQGEGDGVQMAYNFPLMPRLFMALRREDRGPIVQMIEMTESIPTTAQWALFLRNHDELTLEMVTEEERDYMVNEYAADPAFPINLGIRRRLAPLLGGERRRIELMTALLMSLKGSPVLYYGDEIGMGDNPFLGDRNGVRTPMQWSADKNGGFSRAPYHQLFMPPVEEGPYSYRFVNVEAARANPHSLFHFTRSLLGVRNQHRQTFGRGSLTVLPVANRRILAYVRQHEGDMILVAANLSRHCQTAELPLAPFSGLVPVELFSSEPFPAVTAAPYPMTFGPHGFYWLALRPPEAIRPGAIELRAEPESSIAPGPLVSIPLDGGLENLLVDTMVRGNAREALEQTLVDYLPGQRWFDEPERPIERVGLADAIRLAGPPTPVYLASLEVAFSDGGSQRYLLPLLILAEEAQIGRVLADEPHAAVARIVGPDGRGLLVDATAVDRFWEVLYQRWREGWKGRSLRGDYRLTREPGAPFLEPAGPGRRSGEARSAFTLPGTGIQMRLYRRLEPGPNPEPELLGALTAAQFAFAPALRGRLRFVRGAQSHDLGIALADLSEADDVWRGYVDTVHRFLDRIAGSVPGTETGPGADHDGQELPAWLEALAGDVMKLGRVLGVRTAEMHLQLANALDSTPSSSADSVALLDQVRQRLDRVKVWLADHEARELLPEAGLTRQLRLLAPLAEAGGWERIRIQGELHLGRIAELEGEYYLLGFEGDRRLPVERRRTPQQALRDIATLLRSFDYGCRVALIEAAPEVDESAVAWVDLMLDWLDHVVLTAYVGTAGEAAFLPDGTHRGAVLTALLLDKALAEVDWELHHQPDWLVIPLQGLQRLARRPIDSDSPRRAGASPSVPSPPLDETGED